MEKLLLIAGIIGFPIAWGSISVLASHVGGWAKLAAHYTDTRSEQGDTYYMRSGSVGIVKYNACLILRVCENGLRLSVVFPFRIGHPPLFIPWDQFHSVSETGLFFLRFLDAYVGTPVVANVRLPIWVRDHLPSEDATR
ncbi:MAG: hypothetical protein KDA80_11170 [Planctomycetaceae bacterium]|nr:hypothetical protein [Planctomycetaceae bacterium]